MFRNKKRIERVEDRVYRLENEVDEKIKNFLLLKNEYDHLNKKLESIEKNTKAFFEEYVVDGNNLVCPVCGDKVYLVIDDRYKVCFDGLFKREYIENNGTFVYKIKCKNHCVGVRDESIFGAVEKFKSLKVGDDNEESGAAL